MSDLLLIAGASLILALSIGANNSATAMGPAYGAGIRTRRQALLLTSTFFFVGALLGGSGVTGSVAGSYIDARYLAGNAGTVLLVVGLSSLFILLTVGMRVPISTAHATIFCLVGVGLYTSSLNGLFLAANIAWWVFTPVAALLGGYAFAKRVHPWALERVADVRTEQKINRILGVVVTLSGAFIAFSIGANSVGKAMGPAVGFGLEPLQAILLGGAAMAAGAAVLGFRMIHTVGKEIAEICPIRASGVEFISGTLIALASGLGFPVSVSETHTSSVIGLGWGKRGLRKTVKSRVVRRILLSWLLVPVLAMGLTYGLLWVIYRGAPL